MAYSFQNFYGKVLEQSRILSAGNERTAHAFRTLLPFSLARKSAEHLSQIGRITRPNWTSRLVSAASILPADGAEHHSLVVTFLWTCSHILALLLFQF